MSPEYSEYSSRSTGLTKRQKGLILAGVVLAAALLAWRVPRWLIWTGWNCTRDYIDITAGRNKVESHRYFLKTGEVIQDTEFTELYRRVVAEPPVPKWRIFRTLSPGVRHSPNYPYSGAPADRRKLMDALNRAAFTEEAKKKALLTMVALWQDESRRRLASDYIAVLSDLGNQAQEAQTLPIGADQLPELSEVSPWRRWAARARPQPDGPSPRE